MRDNSMRERPQLALPLSSAPAPSAPRASSPDMRAAREAHPHHHLIAYASPEQR